VDNCGESVSSFVFCYIFDLPTQCQLPCSAVQVHNSITQLTWSSPAWAQHTQQLSLPSQCVAHYLCSHPRTGTAQHYTISNGLQPAWHPSKPSGPANHHLTILLAFTVTIILPSYLCLPSPWSYHPTCVYNILQWYIIQCNVQTQVICGTPIHCHTCSVP